MAIEFACTCGQRLRALEENVGRRTRCPTCGTEMDIPRASTGVQSPEPDRPASPRAEQAAVTRKPTSPARTLPEEDWGEEEIHRRERGPVRTSGKAIAALVLAIFTCGCWLLTAIPSIILAALSLGEIARSAGRIQGKGLAITSIVLSAIGIITAPPLLIALLLPAVQRIREATTRIQSANNLRMLGLAMHNYNDTYGRLPPAVVYSADGKPLYSWRVLILPFIEEGRLYTQFKLDEPWDSPNNKQLVARMPKVFQAPRTEADEPGLTHYLVFNGPKAAFDTDVRSGGQRPLRLDGQNRPVFERGVTTTIPRTFIDGTSHTFLIVEAADAVPWSSPQDLSYIPDGPLPRLGGVSSRSGFNACFADASVRFIPLSTDEKILRAYITAAGGEVVPPDAP